ncbi:MAG: acetyltransferase [Flavobacteriaceae bacterium]|nr:MAG: acetyltransferase [Flavobacteriaceae bacterium]
MNNFCLFGAGGHSKAVKDILLSNQMIIDALIDDDFNLNVVAGIPVLSPDKVKDFRSHKFIISIGDNTIRKLISKKLDVEFGTAIHKQTIISNSVKVEEGTVIMPGVNINSGTHIGKYTIINTACVIEHDCNIGNFSHVSPSATITGGVIVGEDSNIGADTVVIPNIRIGKWAFVGAGAIVIDHVPDYAVVVGNPAKIIKYNRY